MTRVKSLSHGSRKNLGGYSHRTHRAKKNRVKKQHSLFELRLKKQHQSEKGKRKSRAAFRQMKTEIIRDGV